jgi:hypothetical protein
MRLTGLFIIAVLVLPVTFTSCGENIFSNEIKGIDSLLTLIGNSEKELNSMDSLKMDSISVEASNNINQLKRVYYTDTVDMEAAKMVTNYKVLRKVGHRARMQRNEIRTETYYTRKQLNTLKVNLEARQMSPDSGKFYYNVEKQATMALLAAYEAYKINLVQSQQLYDSLNPKIEAIITEAQVNQKEK